MVTKSDASTVAAGEFKAKCLRIMDRVSTTRAPVTITKNGKPLVKLVPIDEGTRDVFGCLRDTLEIVGDIESPVLSDTDWKALK